MGNYIGWTNSIPEAPPAPENINIPPAPVAPEPHKFNYEDNDNNNQHNTVFDKLRHDEDDSE